MEAVPGAAAGDRAPAELARPARFGSPSSCRCPQVLQKEEHSTLSPQETDQLLGSGSGALGDHDALAMMRQTHAMMHQMEQEMARSFGGGLLGGLLGGGLFGAPLQPGGPPPPHPGGPPRAPRSPPPPPPQVRVYEV